MGFIFEADVPEYLITGTEVVYMYAQYRMEYQTANPWVTVGCAVYLDTAGYYVGEALNWRGSSEHTGASSDGTVLPFWENLYQELVTADPGDGTEFFTVREDAATIEANGIVSGNRLARCAADLDFPKSDFPEEFFGTYDVKYGVRVYTEYNSQYYTEIPLSQGQIDFQAPIYEDWVNEELDNLANTYEEVLADVITGSTYNGSGFELMLQSSVRKNPDVDAE